MTERPAHREHCGTPAGYRSHRYHREPSCQPCKTAIAQYMREWRYATGRVKNRLTPVHQEPHQ